MVKSKFLAINSYEEYDKRRDEFSQLDFKDKEIVSHFVMLLKEAGVRYGTQKPDDTIIKDYFDLV